MVANCVKSKCVHLLQAQIAKLITLRVTVVQNTYAVSFFLFNNYFNNIVFNPYSFSFHLYPPSLPPFSSSSSSSSSSQFSIIPNDSSPFKEQSTNNVSSSNTLPTLDANSAFSTHSKVSPHASGSPLLSQFPMFPNQILRQQPGPNIQPNRIHFPSGDKASSSDTDHKFKQPSRKDPIAPLPSSLGPNLFGLESLKPQASQSVLIASPSVMFNHISTNHKRITPSNRLPGTMILSSILPHTDVKNEVNNQSTKNESTFLTNSTLPSTSTIPSSITSTSTPTTSSTTTTTTITASSVTLSLTSSKDDLTQPTFDNLMVTTNVCFYLIS